MRPQSKIASVLAPLALAAMMAPLASADDAGFRKDVTKGIKDAEDKIVQLAEATPEAKYSYRPGKGVRSTGEVFMHVAAANFGVPSMAGVPSPEGFNFATYEKSATKKADIVKQLKDSFAHLEKAFEETSEADFEKEVDTPAGKMSERGMYLLLMNHAHEHLGQSIAYARVNGIVPPWSRTMEKVADKDKKADAQTAEGTDKK